MVVVQLVENAAKNLLNERSFSIMPPDFFN